MADRSDQSSYKNIIQEIQHANDILNYLHMKSVDFQSDSYEAQLRKERIIADREAELAIKEKQKNRFRLPYAIISGLLSVVWLCFTAYLIYCSGLENPPVKVDYRVLIAMLGTAFGTMYTPLRVLAKYLFNGQD